MIIIVNSYKIKKDGIKINSQRIGRVDLHYVWLPEDIRQLYTITGNWDSSSTLGENQKKDVLTVVAIS